MMVFIDNALLGKRHPVEELTVAHTVGQVYDKVKEYTQKKKRFTFRSDAVPTLYHDRHALQLNCTLADYRIRDGAVLEFKTVPIASRG